MFQIKTLRAAETFAQLNDWQQSKGRKKALSVNRSFWRRTMHLRLRFYVLSIILLVCAVSGIAQDKPSATKRTTIGLVLQGGGALGLAHVGVITWLEEHHIPVDYIAGTSMGGLVGGVYATGHNATEMRRIVDGINWDEVISGQTPFDDLSFRRKEDARDYPNSLEFGIRKGIQFPAGLNSGQQVSLVLDKVALPYSEIKSFNDLPTPFACVATDLVSGRPKVFRSGSLSLALRSTMSLPGIFTPVRTKDAIYADGGLLQNIPVEVAKDMGADLLLAIHLAEAPIPANASLSSFAVLGNSISVMINANELLSMEKADILVSVPLQKYNALDFNKADEIIKIGYEAAAAKSKILLPLAVDDATWKQYLAERQARVRTNPVPQFIAVDGVNKNLSARVEEQMADLVGKPINFGELDQEIMHLKGFGRYSVLSYQFTERNGEQGLLVKTEESQIGPPIVRPLILIDGSSLKNVTFNMGARVTWLDVGGFRSEWRTDIILFSQYGLRSEYYHPFTPLTHWFVAPRGLVDNTPLYVFDNNKLVSIYRETNLGGAADVGYQFGTTGELRVGYEGGWEHFTPEIGNPKELPTFSGAYGITRLQYKLDRLDSPVIPRAGQNLQADFYYTDTSPLAKPFPSGEIASQNYFRLSEPSSVFLSGYAGTTFNNYDTGLPQFSLGGSQRLVSYGTNELLVDKYFLFQLGYIRQLARLPPLLGSGVYFLGVYEAAQVYGPPHSMINKASGFPTDAAAGLIVNTIFGPVEAAYAYGDTGHHKFFFRIGRLF
jgi:NTE family protein